MRLAEAIDHAAQQLGPGLHPGVVLARGDRIAQMQAVGFFERHRQHAPVAEADHLGANHAPRARADFAEIAHRRFRPFGFHQQTDQLGDAARPAAGFDAREFS